MIEDRTRLATLAALFLRLGATAFGGPAAHISVMHEEFVQRRQWLSREEFLDLLGATHLIPGPNSTEMAIHIGYSRAGIAGLLVAGVCFIAPAALMVTAIAWLYVRFGMLPEAAGILYLIKPVVIAIILKAIVDLARTALRNIQLAILAAAAAIANVLGAGELTVLFASAGLAWVTMRGRRALHPGAIMLFQGVAPAAVAAASFGAGSLFLYFLKIGSVLFGSGYVLIAFLRGDLVERLGVLTEQQLLDAIAVGQMTPGPLFTAATFIGYVLHGPIGATVATIGIFLPAFVFVAISHPMIRRLRRVESARDFLDGINAAAVALMFVVTCQLGVVALVDLPTALVAAASLGLLLTTKVNSAWLIVLAGIAGLLAGW